jgi:hypothetical protein
VIGLIEQLELAATRNNNSSWIYTFHSSLRHALCVLSLPCIRQFSGNGFSGRYSPSSWFLNCPRASAASFDLPTKSQQPFTDRLTSRNSPSSVDCQSQSYLTTDGQSVSLSWCQPPPPSGPRYKFFFSSKLSLDSCGHVVIGLPL